MPIDFQDWQNTMMLHAFQEQLIVAQGTIPNNRRKTGNGGQETTRQASSQLNFGGLITSKMSAMVDLQHSGGEGFCEPFYVLVAEKTSREETKMHMWRLELCSEGGNNEHENDDARYVMLSLDRIPMIENGQK